MGDYTDCAAINETVTWQLFDYPSNAPFAHGEQTRQAMTEVDLANKGFGWELGRICHPLEQVAHK